PATAPTRRSCGVGRCERPRREECEPGSVSSSPPPAMMAPMTSGSGGADGGRRLAELEALLEGAKALIELDDAHGAKAQIIQALDEVERLCGSEPREAGGRRLAERLAALDAS